MPLSTYRVQFNRRFGFGDARAIVSYLHDLGMTDLYASPILAARRGSLHGYDGTDPTRLNPELGDADHFDALVSALQQRGMGLIVDIVPNHQAASTENRWWRDVLENGPYSRFASYFDIDWHRYRGNRWRQPQVMLPILGQTLDRLLKDGGVGLAWIDGAFVLCAGGHTLPVALHTYPLVLGRCIDKLSMLLGSTHALVAAAIRIANVDGKPHADTLDEGEMACAEPRMVAWIKPELRRLNQVHPEIKKAFDEALLPLNGHGGDQRHFDYLRRVLDEQYYRLASWKSEAANVNYKRFFNINDLVRVRVEDAQVFDAMHVFIFQLVREGRITGLRIDHVDGLVDPIGYLDKLRSCLLQEVPTDRHLAVYVEKILQPQEGLGADWPVEGTTGYEFIDAINTLLVDPEGLVELGKIYSGFVGAQTDFDHACYVAKKKVLKELFVGEVRSLWRMLVTLASGQLAGVDESELEHALVEVTARLPVYRTYIRGDSVQAEDQAAIERAITQARSSAPQTGASLAALEWLRGVLLLQAGHQGPTRFEANLQFVKRWQQLTGPVMAKGLEDTVFYTYNRLLSLNEVGCNPKGPSVSADVVAGFDRFNQARSARWPHGLLATATHDTKRGEDARARLGVLSQIPQAWSDVLRRWSRWNRAAKQKVGNQLVPDANDEIFLYQTLIGGWPLFEDQAPAFCDRLRTYVVKAAREAKTHTSWFEPKEAYEAGLVHFIDRILGDRFDNRLFFEDFHRFQENIAYDGALNGLAQVLLKATCPGVPDFYQGTELWDLNLGDPDNRRPVDFAKRAGLLSAMSAADRSGTCAFLRDLMVTWRDGRIKLYLTQKVLHARRAYPALFLEGNYIPLRARGEAAKHACAFARRLENLWLIAAVPRCVAGLDWAGPAAARASQWGNTNIALPAEAPKHWLSLLTQDQLTAATPSPNKMTLPVGQMFGSFPVAVFVGQT